MEDEFIQEGTDYRSEALTYIICLRFVNRELTSST